MALTGQWRYSLVTEKLTATLQIANRIYSLTQEQNDPALIIGAYRALACTSTFWANSSPRDNARSVVFKSGAREA